MNWLSMGFSHGYAGHDGRRYSVQADAGQVRCDLLGEAGQTRRPLRGGHGSRGAPGRHAVPFALKKRFWLTRRPLLQFSFCIFKIRFVLGSRKCIIEPYNYRLRNPSDKCRILKLFWKSTQ